MRRSMFISAVTGLALAASALGVGGAAQAAGVKPRIQGTAVDQRGHLLDDVTVKAKSGNTVVASALTYANQAADGPQHGYFWLDVHNAGTYTVTLSKQGYTGVVLTGIEVGAHRVVSLGEIELTKKLLEPSKCGSELKTSPIGKAEKGKILVTIKSPSNKVRPTGALTATTDGRKVGKDSMKKSDDGKLWITLDKLAPGKHDIKTKYDGDDNFKGCKAGQVTLKVLSVKHVNRQVVLPAIRPNVLW